MTDVAVVLGKGWKLSYGDSSGSETNEITNIDSFDLPDYETMTVKSLPLGSTQERADPGSTSAPSFNVEWEYNSTQYAAMETIRGAAKWFKADPVDSSLNYHIPGFITKNAVKIGGNNEYVKVTTTIQCSAAETFA